MLCSALVPLIASRLLLYASCTLRVIICGVICRQSRVLDLEREVRETHQSIRQKEHKFETQLNEERSQTLLAQQEVSDLFAQLQNQHALREDLEAKRIKTEDFLRNVGGSVRGQRTVVCLSAVSFLVSSCPRVLVAL